MQLRTVTKYRPDGSVQWKESFKVFQINDTGKGIVTAQLRHERKPFGKDDQAVIDAGYKLTPTGYMAGNIWVSFKQGAYEKAKTLREGSVIEDVEFDADICPYVNSKTQQITYRNSPKWDIVDFNIKQFAGASNTTQQTTQPTPQTNTTYAENPFAKNAAVSPMYQKKPVQQAEPVQATVMTGDDFAEY